MKVKRARGGEGRGIVVCVGLALLLISAAGAAETGQDFSAATGDGTIITKDGQGGYDAIKVDSVDAGADAGVSGTTGTGGAGGSAAGQRDDDSSCSCSVEQSPGPGFAALTLLLLAARSRRS